MAGTTAYPTALDTTTTLPTAATLGGIELDGDGDDDHVHENVHGVEDEAIVAIETKVGIGASTPAAGKGLVGDGAGSSAWTDSPDFAGSIMAQAQPCFQVQNSVTDTDVTGDGTAYKGEYDAEIYDVGGDFDTDTDTFTAPVTGKYAFTLFVALDQLDGAGHLPQIQLISSNRSVRLLRIDETPLVKLHIMLSAIVEMDANDTLTVEIDVDDGLKVVDYFGYNGAHLLANWLAGHLLVS